MKHLLMTLSCILTLYPPINAHAQESQPDLSLPAPAIMTNEILQTLIQRVDPEFTGEPGRWRLRIDTTELHVVTDTAADRMRIVSAVRSADGLSIEELQRILQANFDSTLDARYAIARGVMWSTFIHPLSSLTAEEFLSGLGQTVNLTTSYGDSYSSGLFNYRGGDSEGLREKELLERLQEYEEAI